MTFLYLITHLFLLITYYFFNWTIEHPLKHSLKQHRCKFIIGKTIYSMSWCRTTIMLLKKSLQYILKFNPLWFLVFSFYIVECYYVLHFLINVQVKYHKLTGSISHYKVLHELVLTYSQLLIFRTAHYDFSATAPLKSIK